MASPVIARPTYRMDFPTARNGLAVVREAFAEAGWKPTRSADWTLWWTLRPTKPRFLTISSGRWFNHVPGMATITRKDLLASTLELGRLKRRLRRCHPETYVMPDQRDAFLRAAARDPAALWIYKPIASSNADGVRLVEEPERVSTRRGFLVQRYISSPHLLDGRKYTLRSYVAIVWAERLEAYLYSDGLALIANRPFTTDARHLSDRAIHITNSSVQRTIDPKLRRTLTHRAYRHRIRREGRAADQLFDEIGGVALELVRASAPFIAEACRRWFPRQRGRAFELLGLDLAVDRDLRPWLLECNINPSLTVESGREEQRLKQRLLRDLLRLVAVDGVSARSGFKRLR